MENALVLPGGAVLPGNGHGGADAASGALERVAAFKARFITFSIATLPVVFKLDNLARDVAPPAAFSQGERDLMASLDGAYLSPEVGAASAEILSNRPDTFFVRFSDIAASAIMNHTAMVKLTDLGLPIADGTPLGQTPLGWEDGPSDSSDDDGGDDDDPDGDVAPAHRLRTQAARRQLRASKRLARYHLLTGRRQMEEAHSLLGSHVASRGLKRRARRRAGPSGQHVVYAESEGGDGGGVGAASDGDGGGDADPTWQPPRPPLRGPSRGTGGSDDDEAGEGSDSSSDDEHPSHRRRGAGGRTERGGRKGRFWRGAHGHKSRLQAAHAPLQLPTDAPWRRRGGAGLAQQPAARRATEAGGAMEAARPPNAPIKRPRPPKKDTLASPPPKRGRRRQGTPPHSFAPSYGEGAAGPGDGPWNAPRQHDPPPKREFSFGDLYGDEGWAEVCFVLRLHMSHLDRFFRWFSRF